MIRYPPRIVVRFADADADPIPTVGQLEASYDSRYFALEQKQTLDDEESPTWHVWFRRVRGSGLAMHYLHQLFGATRPEISVRLPPDMLLALQINTSSGLTTAELGGLRISEVHAEVSTGGLDLGVSGLSAPMERFEIDTRQASVVVRNLGDASPRKVVIDCTMGTAQIDLRGEWQRDADLLLETEMARGTLRLPDGVTIEGLEEVGGVGAQWSIGDDEIPRPTLRFTVERTAGGLKIER